ncbi:MAG: hypothetical protein PF487_11485 [Bacteroidales bacterium]|jgi:hypothetical protein|nr:hypothetical protein [Bacteroidales bacterium]
MADNENTSRLLTNSEEIRKTMLAKNSDLYVENKAYKTGHPNSISDGDKKGREPEDVGGSVGTSVDIETRESMLAKNSDLYSCGNIYTAGSDNV